MQAYAKSFIVFIEGILQKMKHLKKKGQTIKLEEIKIVDNKLIMKCADCTTYLLKSFKKTLSIMMQ